MIENGESQTLDFKFCISDSRKIAKSLSAFANTDGGTLLIGVKDNGSIAGVRSDEEYYMIEGAANLYCKPEVKIDVKVVPVNGKNILVVYVPKSCLVPHYAQCEDKEWRAFVRSEDKNFEANNVMYKYWRRKQESKPVHLRFDDRISLFVSLLYSNEKFSISKLSRLLKLPLKETENILVDFMLLDIVSAEFSESGVKYFLHAGMDELSQNNLLEKLRRQ